LLTGECLLAIHYLDLSICQALLHLLIVPLQLCFGLLKLSKVALVDLNALLLLELHRPHFLVLQFQLLNSALCVAQFSSGLLNVAPLVINFKTQLPYLLIVQPQLILLLLYV